MDRQRLLNLVTGIIFAIFVVLTIRYQINLLTYIENGDESETIVTAKMIAAGGRLYSEIFTHHGPLTFLPGIFLEKNGDFGVSVHRIPITILQLFALAAIYFSPLLKNKSVRNIYTGLAASVMMLYLPEFFGHTYLYQVMAGLLLIIIFAQFTLPAIACPEKLTANKVILGNLLIGSLPFLAISYLPISVLLFVASIRNQFFLKSFMWLAAGIASNVLFLASIGSIPGYFSFHIYLNSKVLPLYNGGQSVSQLINAAFLSATNDLSGFVILIMITMAVAGLASNEKFPYRSILVGLGIGSLIIRGVIYLHQLPYVVVEHKLAYYYACLALPLIFFNNRTRVSYQSVLIVCALSIICFIKLSLLLPADKQKLNSQQIPETTEFAQLAQVFTSKHDRIIAYSFRNFDYIAADRLPASGNFFYFPWQEKYNEHPKFGIKIDACQEIEKYRPKIMLIDKIEVWDWYPWDSYAGCIQKLIDKNYRQIPSRPYYIRSDMLSDDMGITNVPESYKMQPSTQLNARTPIKIFMTSNHQDDKASLKRIGVMFGTYARQNPGDAELHLKGPDGTEFVQRFSLPVLANNKYRYFDLDSKRYTSGEIDSITGGGVSTWESQNKKGGSNTCITYEYSNGKRRFTPGCPLF